MVINNPTPQIQFIGGLLKLIGANETSGAAQAQWATSALDDLVPVAFTILESFGSPSNPGSAPGPSGADC